MAMSQNNFPFCEGTHTHERAKTGMNETGFYFRTDPKMQGCSQIALVEQFPQPVDLVLRFEKGMLAEDHRVSTAPRSTNSPPPSHFLSSARAKSS